MAMAIFKEDAACEEDRLPAVLAADLLALDFFIFINIPRSCGNDHEGMSFCNGVMEFD